MKSLVSATVGMLVWLTFATAFAQSATYTFATVDISVPGRPGSLAIPQDINDEGLIVTNIVSTTDGPEVLIADPLKPRSRGFVTTTFRCGTLPSSDTAAYSVNFRGDVTGACVTEPNASKIFGFIRDRNGRQVLLDVPGADHTFAFGISADRQVVGQYYNPRELNQSGLRRIHGFRWEDGRFDTIDFPLSDTYTSLRSVNKRGQILGDYFRFDPKTNATLEHNWFVYDSGQFNLYFPQSLEWDGGPALLLADMNDAGQVIGQRYNAGPGWDGLFLFDHGRSFNIAVPPDFAYSDVRGMNNKGQFVGMYLKPAGVDPYYGWQLYEAHGYIATPATGGVTISAR